MASKCTNYDGETTEYCLTDSFIFYYPGFVGGGMGNGVLRDGCVWTMGIR